MSSSHTNHNYSSLTDFTGGPSTSHFGVYQKTSVGTGDVTIRTLIPVAISAEPYRKALIAKLFSVRFYPSLTQLTSRSVTSWRPSPCISPLIRGCLSGSQRLLLPQSALICFLLLTCRELVSWIPPVNPLRSRIQPSALTILLILPFVPLFQHISLIHERRKKLYFSRYHLGFLSIFGQRW